MILEFCWDESDYVAARFSWLLHHPWEMYQAFPGAVSAALVCVLLTILAVASYRPDWRMAFDFAVLGPVFFVAPWLLWARWRFHREFRRKFSTCLDATAIIDERGVTLPLGGPPKTHLWVGFTRIYESHRVIVLETGGKDFIFLPKSAMSGAQLEELKRLAAATLDCAVKWATP